MKSKSSLSGNNKQSRLVKGRTIRSGVLNEIRKDHPAFGDHDSITMDELNTYRQRYIENTLKEEIGDLSHIEQDVVKSIKKKELLSDNTDDTVDQAFSYGQRLADKIASFGGSWTFIIIFMLFILVWMMINILYLVHRAFDPYPFILLNLILSCLAAMQAPVIMMSQNRQEEKDRERARNDYQINLKSELEIRTLHEKIDHFMQVQQEHLLEVQEIQIDMMKELMSEIQKIKNK